MLAFAAALLALLLRSLARALGRGTRISEAWAVAPVVLALTAAVVAVGWLFGSQIAGQFDLLAADLPEGISRAARDVGAAPWGAWLLDQMQGMNLAGADGQAAGYIASIFGSVFRAGAYIAVLLFAGVYLAAQPERYLRGLLRLVPPGRRERVGEVLNLVGTTL